MKYSLLRLKVIVAVLIVNLCPPLATPAQTSGNLATSQHEFLEKARASIVVVTGEDKAGSPIAPGLGFWINGNLIATDSRVVQSAVRIHVTIPGKESNPIEIRSLDSYRFATVLIATKPAGVLPLPVGESDKLEANDKVYLIGDPALQAQKSEKSLGKTVILNEGRYFEIAGPLSSANRGGPVLNSKGEVIGIAGESLDGLNEILIIPAAYLTKLLRDRNVDRAGVGMGSGGGMGPAQGSSEGKGMGVGPPSTGPGYGSGVFDPNAQSGGPRPTDTTVDTKPVLLKGPRPLYTEEARKNRIQGVVTLRVQVGEDGNVKHVRVVSGLPYGLNERAIEAAYQIKFKPATKDGLAVPYWLAIQVEFNLK